MLSISTQYPHWTGRRDKKGQPIFYLDIEYLSPKNRADFQKSSEELRVPNFTLPEAASSIRGFLPFEYTTRFVLPLCSAVAGRPVTQSIRIIDISKLSMAQALSLLQYIRESGKTLADSYPEIIDRIFVSASRPQYTFFRNAAHRTQLPLAIH
jgi:hypothetical protein